MPSGLEHVSPDVAAVIAANAQAAGLSVDEYLRLLMSPPRAGEDVTASSTPPGRRMTVAEFDAFLDELASGESPEPSTYEGNYSREDIYFDHD